MIIALLIACGIECPPGHVPGEDGCAFSEEEVAALMTRFDEGELERINAEVFSDYASGVDRQVWVSPVLISEDSDLTAVDLYQEIEPTDGSTPLSAAFPVGTLIVHERVDGLEGHTVQVKRGDGFVDPLGRDWWFGKFYDDGTPDEVECQPCETCHNTDNRAYTEGLWGVPLEAR